MKALMDFFGGAAKILTWFLSAIVIPVTAWFIVLREDVKGLQRDAVAGKDYVRIVETRVYDLEKHVQTSNDEIMRSLGRIEGELKRIR